MELNPVFINELRQSIVRRKPIMALAIWACITFLVCYFAQFTGSNSDFFAMLPQFLLPLIVPIFTAGVFAKEYEQQTWQDLYLTRLTNWQVFSGKFTASLLLSSLAALALIPAVMLMLIVKAGYNLSYMAFLTPGWWTVKMIVYMLVSTVFYVLVAMVCSRYCGNRRMATVVCYVSLFLYAFLNYVLWETAGKMLAESTRSIDYYGYGSTYLDSSQLPPDPMGDPWMQKMHLIFGLIVGSGSALLLWVSLSEQRGYRRSSAEAEKRSWQPVAHKRKARAEADAALTI